MLYAQNQQHACADKHIALFDSDAAKLFIKSRVFKLFLFYYFLMNITSEMLEITFIFPV